MSELSTPKLLSLCLMAGLVAGCNSGTAPPDGAQAAASQESVVSDDPYLWLEEVTGEKPVAWAKEQSDQANAALAQTPEFKRLEASLRAAMDSDDKLPLVNKMGGHYYNFWKDAKNERGVWRRTTLEEYRKPKPSWEVVIDLDALGREENENWVWRSPNCLRPDYARCLISLSRGGADANVVREFDMATKTWVKDGFSLPEAKGGLTWIDRDTVYVSTNFGPGSMTDSGYPRLVKEWKRGTPLEAATLIYEGQPQDMSVSGIYDDMPGFERHVINRMVAFYSNEYYLRGADNALTKIEKPDSAELGVRGPWLTLNLRDPWDVGGKSYAAGSLLATRFDDFMAGKREFTVLFEPTDTVSLNGTGWVRDHMLVQVLDDVKNRAYVLTPPAADTAPGTPWKRAEFKATSGLSTLDIYPVDNRDSNQVWFGTNDYLTPPNLSLAEVDENGLRGKPELLKSVPAMFDASRHVIEQHFVASKDGARIPYFLVRQKDLAFDGSAPTLLYGYGGFEISMRPGYGSNVGIGWLERGGVYVVANIRGGGEYGPRWHQAALKQHRNRAYEDFAAVAQDLIARKVTSAKHLGIQGGSNGGLLTGNMLTQYPELFGAVVIQVPLLDMQRYNKLLAGASWMAEYGDPDKPEEWAFIKTFSPYHLFDPAKDYPPVLITTSTRDDRVHPGHARKMAAKMLEAGKDVTYYENVEGGHGGSANNAQAAHMAALAYTFLWQKLSGEGGASTTGGGR